MYSLVKPRGLNDIPVPVDISLYGDATPSLVSDSLPFLRRVWTVGGPTDRLYDIGTSSGLVLHQPCGLAFWRRVPPRTHITSELAIPVGPRPTSFSIRRKFLTFKDWSSASCNDHITPTGLSFAKANLSHLFWGHTHANRYVFRGRNMGGSGQSRGTDW